MKMIKELGLLISIGLNGTALVMHTKNVDLLKAKDTELYRADLRIKDLTQKLKEYKEYSENVEKATALYNEEILKVQNELWFGYLTTEQVLCGLGLAVVGVFVVAACLYGFGGKGGDGGNNMPEVLPAETQKDVAIEIIKFVSDAESKIKEHTASVIKESSIEVVDACIKSQKQNFIQLSGKIENLHGFNRQTANELFEKLSSGNLSVGEITSNAALPTFDGKISADQAVNLAAALDEIICKLPTN